VFPRIRRESERARRCREKAAFYRRVIEEAERPGGRGSYPGWARTKAILLEMAEAYGRDGRDAEARAASLAANHQPQS
jgi:hypothetical protein